MAQSDPVTGEQIANLIRTFIKQSEFNTMQTASGEPAWEDCLIGFSSGSDPLWQQYKEYIGAFHWTPWEVFNQHCPQENVTADQLTVVSWILPQKEAVKESNRNQKAYPSEFWARIRIFGEKFNMALRNHMVESLKGMGIPAVAPMLAPNFTIVKSKTFSYASSWSERHAAYAAGLGTFGLCDGLITEKGKAMRAGSVVLKAQIDPTPRIYTDHHAYCLFYAKGTCGKCIERCPADAISKKGHDKEKCRRYLAKTAQYVKENFHFDGYGCGLCQTDVPCESMIPVKDARIALEKGELPPPPKPLA